MPRIAPAVLYLLCLALPAGADEPATDPARPDSSEPTVVSAGKPLREIDRTPLRCIHTMGLRRTIAADGRTLLFLGRTDYMVNVLRHTCPGLRRGASVSYRVRGGRLGSLCSGDQIYPFLDQSLACSLGEFHEISEAQAAALLNPVAAWLRSNAIGIKAIPPPSD